MPSDDPNDGEQLISDESKPVENAENAPNAEIAAGDKSEPQSTSSIPITPDAGPASPLTNAPAPIPANPATPVANSTPPSDVPAPLLAPQTPSTPAKRRPNPPRKGILKPPPPPAKPTLSNKIRDIVVGSMNVVGESARTLFEGGDEQGTSIAGPSYSGRGGPSGSSGYGSSPSGSGSAGTSHTVGSATTGAAAVTAAVGGTLNAISGRFALGLGRFVAASTSASSNASSPSSSPMPKSISLPETGAVPMSEKSRQKQPLKRATFVLPSMSITYPISSQGEPWSQKVLEDRKRIETTHRSWLTTTTGPDYWTPQKLVTLYESACRIREERPRLGVVRSLETLPTPPRPRILYLTLVNPDPSLLPPSTTSPTPRILEIPLNRHAAECLADVLSAEWGLSDLRLENGVLEGEDALKPVLHALLISGTLPSLSLAGNRRIKSGGWRLVSVFLKRARSLKYLNLSDTVWDRKGIDHLVQALNCTHIGPLTTNTSQTEAEATLHSTIGETPAQSVDVKESTKEEDNGNANQVDHLKRDWFEKGDDLEDTETTDHSYGAFILPAPLLKRDDGFDEAAAIQTLRMDGCGFRAATLEPLAAGIRSSDLKNISLRRNKIGPLGAVSLALMIRDYPDSSSLSSLPILSTPSSGFLNPTDSPSSVPIAYTARPRRHTEDTAVVAAAMEDASLPPIPLVVSSSNGGITSRTLPEGYTPATKIPLTPVNPNLSDLGGMSNNPNGVNPVPVEGKLSSAAEIGGASIALQRSVRALDGVERIGRLLTLDLKSNDIKHGVGYIAQVLKRNRTLKVLNLSDNKIEAPGLATLAEALKYNSSLETLDVSSNPCCGPSLEGIAALRTTFTVNASLKRLFLSDTGLATEGAIALAEFLPETKTLLHLDLTSNPLIDVAGIMAISVGLRSNKLIRCLDLSITPNNEDMSELSQNILQVCIRNTELAASATTSVIPATKQSDRPVKPKTKLSRAGQEAIWAPIKKSALVRSVKEADEARAAAEREASAKSPEGQAREYVYTLRPERVLIVSEETVRDLGKWYEAGRMGSAKLRNNGVWEPGQLPKDEFGSLVERGKALRERLVDQIQETVDSTLLDRLLSLNDLLTGLIDQSKTFKPPPRLLLPSQIVPTAHNTYYSPIRSGPSLISPGRANNHYANASTPSPPALHTRPIQARRHGRGFSVEISSPNFSIGDSDDSDPEEINVKDIKNPHLPSSSTPLKNSGLGIDSLSKTFDGPSRPLIGILSEDVVGVNGSGLENSEDRERYQRENASLDDLQKLASPVEKASRAWVEEEGEIFRKGTKLGVADEEEIEENEEISGEKLKQEILDTPVARSPTRRMIPLEGPEGDETRSEDAETN